MEETRERRAAPTRLWPEAKSVIVLGMNYGPDQDPRALLDKHDAGNISVYARNRDYHDVIKGKLKEMAGKFAARSGADVKVFVDTAPVMEKPLAEAAGLGWQGKHTNLVSRRFGSWLFLGEILLSVELPADAPEQDHCGQCHACLDVCPTRAFPAPYQLEARRCISYLTIEHEGPIDPELRPLIGNRIYGCDDCLAVCPWNKFAKAARETTLVPQPAPDPPSLVELAELDDAAFRKRFAGSAIKRIGRDRFVRNVAYALGNSGSRDAIPVLRNLTADSSALVRDAARWALSVVP
jgi:epoxyqueuosine reductase